MSDFRARLGAAIANAIVDECRADDGPVTVDARAARQAMTSVLAMMIEAEPAIRTEALMEEACQLVAAETLIQLKAMRRHAEQTGQRPWDAVIERKH